jgi:hypothetical protein
MTVPVARLRDRRVNGVIRDAFQRNYAVRGNLFQQLHISGVFIMSASGLSRRFGRDGRVSVLPPITTVSTTPPANVLLIRAGPALVCPFIRELWTTANVPTDVFSWTFPGVGLVVSERVESGSRDDRPRGRAPRGAAHRTVPAEFQLE